MNLLPWVAPLVSIQVEGPGIFENVGRLTVRASGGAAVGVVTELVDVETTLSVGVVAGDVPGDGGRGVLVSLLEGDGARDLGVSADDSN